MTAKEKQISVYMNAGMKLFNTGTYSNAMAEFKKALQLDPINYVALTFIGKIFYMTGNPFGQELAAKQQVKYHPNKTDGYQNLAEAHHKMGKAKECVDILKKAVQKFPKDPLLVPNLLFSLNSAEFPASEAFELHRKYAANYEPNHILPKPPFPKTQKIKVGFVSSDFYAHSIYHFLSPLLMSCNKERFELHLFSSTPKERHDAITEQYKKFPVSWHEIRSLSDREAADLIKKEQISVLFDLGGYTSAPAVRLGIFGLRPAPVQITWLGYPSTTGMKSMDFRITDNFADSQDADKYHTEKLLRFSTPFLCYNPITSATSINSKFSEKAENEPIIFGSFNNTTKFTDETISLWSSVLKRVPNSLLSLKSKAFNDPSMCNYYQEKFAGMGVEKERIETKGFSPSMPSHFLEYLKIDIALDPTPYNGTTTTCEAMLMGVPTLALMGERHVARVSAALNIQAGFPEFAAKDETEFAEIAASWASRRKELCEYKNAMRAKMLASPLCDAESWAREWEKVISSLVEVPQC